MVYRIAAESTAGLYTARTSYWKVLDRTGLQIIANHGTTLLGCSGWSSPKIV